MRANAEHFDHQHGTYKRTDCLTCNNFLRLLAACGKIHKFFRLLAVRFSTSCDFLRLDFQLLTFRMFLRVNCKNTTFYFLRRFACSCHARTSCATSCAYIIFGLYCRVAAEHSFPIFEVPYILYFALTTKRLHLMSSKLAIYKIS